MNRPIRTWASTIANLLLLAVVGGSVLLVQVSDRAAPAVQATVQRYTRAMAAQDEAAALAEIAPSRRAEWTDWVHQQAGNVYDVKGIGVREPSMVARLTQHVPGMPFEVSAVIDVNHDYPDEYYQATTQAAVVQEDGRWFLAEPLLAREALRPTS
jgi:hypothetical protein